MLVGVVTVYWASAQSFLLQVMLLLMMLSLIVLIVWDTGTTVMRGPATIRYETLLGFYFEYHVMRRGPLF